ERPMERLYLPPSLRYLEPMRVVRGASLDHTSFAYDLVTALRPRLVVDVGTGAGMFMAVACQAMRDHDIDGLVHGIDPWSDDEGAAELVELLTASDVAEREGLSRFYQHADRHHRFRNEVQSQSANLARRGNK